HRQHVEIATIYHAPGATASAALHAVAYQRELLLATKAQYARLASVAELAFDAESFDPAAAATALHQLPPAIGRGATFGELAPA
ncbi:MAG: hypothetical protein M3Q69_05090, partial [Acidobacteriota bacterium]|nr:hypothetical protein [Acidobacteriota bacterium]